MSSDNKDLMSSIEDIRAAEKEAAEIRDNANKKSEELILRTKEELIKISQKVDEDITLMKDERSREYKKEVDKDVKKILSDAEKNAAKINSKALDSKELQKLIDFILQG